MGYTLHRRVCDWAVDEPIDLKGAANLVAGQHISETGHSVALERIAPEGEDFYRGPGRTEVLTESSVSLP